MTWRALLLLALVTTLLAAPGGVNPWWQDCGFVAAWWLLIVGIRLVDERADAPRGKGSQR